MPDSRHPTNRRGAASAMAIGPGSITRPALPSKPFWPHGTDISPARCRRVGCLGQFLRSLGPYLRAPGGREVGDYVGARGAIRGYGPQVRHAVPVEVSRSTAAARCARTFARGADPHAAWHGWPDRGYGSRRKVMDELLGRLDMERGP